MNNKIVLRRHVITLLPDTFLFLVSFLFLLTLEIIHSQSAPVVEDVCIVAALLFSMIGVIDILKWYGFSVTIKPNCVEVRRFWFLTKRYCRGARRVQPYIRPVQNIWDEWLNKGTLVVYEPVGEVATLDNLSKFDQLVGSRLVFG